MFVNNTAYIARGGLYTALGVLFIYLSTITPTSKLYLLGIASCIVPLSILTIKIKHSIFMYLSTSLLSLLLMGIKGGVIAYILFFGLYGFVKYFIEKLRNMYLEIFLKLVYFNASIGLVYVLYKVFFTDLFKVNIPIYALILMFQVVFLIFDYALTLFVAYVHRYIKIS
ncbi:hypothetical protein HMPREF1982_02201 [Clostridiales bacterium oral taxon 876 str. F0540]|nr:hypothetical protein HMPREF1982_02201 [Clostridiales bacterium oral taxon 876 str. F0540]